MAWGRWSTSSRQKKSDHHTQISLPGPAKGLQQPVGFTPDRKEITSVLGESKREHCSCTVRIATADVNLSACSDSSFADRTSSTVPVLTLAADPPLLAAAPDSTFAAAPDPTPNALQSSAFVPTADSFQLSGEADPSHDESRCALLQQFSQSACVPGLTFGCENDRLWVDAGCRGSFRCGDSGALKCGSLMDRYRSDRNITCVCDRSRHNTTRTNPSSGDTQGTMRARSHVCSSNRHAHVISMSTGPTYQMAKRRLMEAGFHTVSRIQPVSLDDKRLLLSESMLLYEHEKNSSVRPWRAAMSNMLTHADVWQRPHARNGEWIYIFEDDAKFDPYALHHILPEPVNITTHGHTLVPSASVKDMQCILDDMERISASLENTLLYFGHEGIIKPQRFKLLGPETSVITGGHIVDACTAMATHAYAIRRSHATDFFDRVRRKNFPVGENMSAVRLAHTRNKMKHSFYRFQLDVNLRGYYERLQGGGHWLKYKFNVTRDWPRCLDVPHKALRDSGLHERWYTKECAVAQPLCPFGRSGTVSMSGLFVDDTTLRPSELQSYWN